MLPMTVNGSAGVFQFDCACTQAACKLAAASSASSIEQGERRAACAGLQNNINLPSSDRGCNRALRPRPATKYTNHLRTSTLSRRATSKQVRSVQQPLLLLHQ